VSHASAAPIIVTAADHRYARSLAQLLLSVERHSDDELPRVVIVDLGLTNGDRNLLARRFPWCGVEPFPFDAHPAHVRHLEICAWKPIAIDETVRHHGGPVLWLDSATIIHEPLAAVFDRITHDGLLTLAGQSPIARWCHEATQRFMGASAEDVQARCRSAGILGFDGSRADVRQLVADWRRLALIPECIAPPGATRANHRYDQAILSLLLVRLTPDTTCGKIDSNLAVSGSSRIDGLDEEIDISSVRPLQWASTRNTVAPWVPLALDPIVRAYYAMYKAADRALIRARSSHVIRDAAFAIEDLIARALAGVFLIRATRRGRRFLRAKSDLAGRACHCATAEGDVHVVHSEGLREGCDLVIDYASNVENPDRPQIPLSLLTVRLKPDTTTGETIASQIGAGDTVHVKTDHLDTFVRDILPRAAGPIVLVTGDSDISPIRRFEHLLDDGRLLHWFAQNCDVAYDHPHLTRIPIGLDNPIYTKLEKRLGFAIGAMVGKIPFDATFSHNAMGNQAQLQDVKRRMTRTLDEKPTRVLCTFHRNQQLLPNADTIPDRAEAYAVLRDHPDCDFVEKRLPQQEYWRIHDDFAFEVSPRGRGLDCFRTWECLFLGTIPIVKTSPLDALYRQEQFPVVIVESYDEITSANLRRWKMQLEGCFTPELIRRLSNDYWLERIRGVARSVDEIAQRGVDAGARV